MVELSTGDLISITNIIEYVCGGILFVLHFEVKFKTWCLIYLDYIYNVLFQFTSNNWIITVVPTSSK